MEIDIDKNGMITNASMHDAMIVAFDETSACFSLKYVSVDGGIYSIVFSGVQKMAGFVEPKEIILNAFVWSIDEFRSLNDGVQKEFLNLFCVESIECVVSSECSNQVLAKIYFSTISDLSIICRSVEVLKGFAASNQ